MNEMLVRIRRWSDWLEASDHRRQTVKQYRYQLLRFAADTLTDPWEATEEDLVDYFASLPSRGEVRRAAFRALRSYWAWAGPQAGRDPMERIHIRRRAEGPGDEPLSPLELRALVQAAFRREERRGWGIILLATTGIRVGSLVAIRPEDVRGDSLWLREAKGGRSYLVPLSRPARAAVRHLAEGRAPTLLGVGAEGFRRWLRQAALDARIGRRVYPHLLRHSFATALARRADPRTWQAAMGHADLSQYARYAHPDEAAVREAVERIAPELLGSNGNGHRPPAQLPPEPEPAPPRPVTLTQGELRRALGERDWEILRLLAEDLTNAEIACELDLATSTVKEHLTPLYRMLGVRGREEAAGLMREILAGRSVQAPAALPRAPRDPEADEEAWLAFLTQEPGRPAIGSVRPGP